MADIVPVRRALLSVSDKSGLADLARVLTRAGAEIISTGGTARALRDAGATVRDVADLTGFPEMMDGRVKTLHPRVHGGILADRDRPDHAAAMRSQGIEPIDLVCVNLYPFRETVARPGITLAEAIEQIDVGGPAMLRAAAKNAAHVAAISSPAQYAGLIESLGARGGTTLEQRRAWAREAFAHTAAYDAAIAAHLAHQTTGDEPPPALVIGLSRGEALRYGENPHQRAWVYHDGGESILTARPLHGKAMSYSNVLDAMAAADVVATLARLAPADHAQACVVKHGCPCGSASAPTLLMAIDLALLGDETAAYGGILVTTARLDAQSAARLTREGVFLEVIIAPAYDDAALAALRARWTGVRLLEFDPASMRQPRQSARLMPGGALVQDTDTRFDDPATWRVAAGPAPSPATLQAASLLEAVVRALWSNAVAIGVTTPGGGMQLVGVGAGQVDRVTACRIAADKAGPRARGAIAVSDAFFPFDDGPRLLLDAGVTTLVHPGGSKRDEDTIALCAQRGVTCLLTGVRHFRH